MSAKKNDIIEKDKNFETGTEEIMDNRYRNYMFILYPEWPNYDEILQDLKGSFKRYAYILHKPEQDEKKPHTHFLLFLDNPRTIESISKRVDIPLNLVKRVKSIRGACRYLTHIDNEDKIQYDLTEVHVSKSFQRDYYKAFDDLMSDSDILDNIYSFITDNSKVYNSIEMEVALSRFVCDNAFERVFKRYYNTIIRFINFIVDDNKKL